MRIYPLDALRGIAAVSVMLFHLTYWVTPYRTEFAFPYGHFGVELFFMISGFVIFMTLGKVDNVQDFIASRMGRLYPAFWAGAILTCSLCTLIETVDPSIKAWGGSFADLPINLTMLEDYLNGPYNVPIDLAYWTLSAEIMFYIVMGTIFCSGYLPKIDRICVGYMVALHALRVAVFAAGVRMPSPFAWFSLINYGHFFIIGITLFRLRSGVRSVAVVAALVLAVLYSAWGGTERSQSISGVPYLLVTASLATVMTLAVFDRLPFLAWRPLVFLGNISYPLYLVHQRIGSDIMFYLQGRQVSIYVSTCLAILVAFIFATLIHYRVEQRYGLRLRRIVQAYLRRLTGTMSQGLPEAG